MKILKQGQLPEDKEFTTTCRRCKTEFQFKKSEGKETSDQRDGNYVSINCPLPGCGNLCTVASIIARLET